jgi:CTP:molybdopterin cytidylyltransferase MocA
MTITGIIPAAGTGSRWGGYYKELLPTGHNEHLIDRAVLTCRVGGAERVVIITTPEKISAHASHFRYRDSDIIFKIQDGVNDIYSAIESSFSWMPLFN